MQTKLCCDSGKVSSGGLDIFAVGRGVGRSTEHCKDVAFGVFTAEVWNLGKFTVVVWNLERFTAEVWNL